MEKQPGDSPGGLAESTGKATEKQSEQESSKNGSAIPPAAATVPDPDEDDLDDLDDMLDEFAPSKTQAAGPSGPGRPLDPVAAEDEEEDGLSDEDFAKQLQQGMAELLGGLDSNPEMQAQFESMLKELGAAADADTTSGKEPAPSPPVASTSAPSSTKSKKKSKGKKKEEISAAEESFQDTIRKTMERLNASGDSASAAAAASSEEDLMAEMLKAMQASGLGGDGEGSEEDFSKMLLGMMEQLTNKEILYEPMKELDDKFPDWMKQNEGKVKEEDMKRYKEQQGYVKEIVGRFEAKGYSDDNAADREYIVERMQKMQAAGSPPPDLVGDMAAAQEAFGAPEEGCPQQ